MRSSGGTVAIDLVHPQHVGPQLLVTEGVVAEDGLPISMVPLVIVSIVTFALV